jgi:hypothetical protein
LSNARCFDKMHAFHDLQEEVGEPRLHPWDRSASDPNARFVNFRNHPELVRTSLEDFVPYAHQPAIDRFFELVEWMNSSESIWETTESKFWRVSTHTNRFFSPYRLTCSGRLVFFCRDHLWQCTRSEWAFTNLLARLENRQPTPLNACVGVFTMPTLFLSLSDDGGRTAPECKALGVRCYGFGNTEDEAFQGFGSGVHAVRDSSHQMSAMIIAADHVNHQLQR